MMETVSLIGEWAIGLLVLAGAIIAALSVLGLIRFEDVYLRAHAATKSATLSVMFILTAAFLYFAFYLEEISIKLLLGIVFVFLTGPVAGHLNGRAAYRSGVSLWSGSVHDDMKAAVKKERASVRERSK